LIPRFPG
jgi:hypothetical protein